MISFFFKKPEKTEPVKRCTFMCPHPYEGVSPVQCEKEKGHRGSHVWHCAVYGRPNFYDNPDADRIANSREASLRGSQFTRLRQRRGLPFKSRRQP